jgi:anaerobic magnesium-protoporphyrin IX monomethyl ester cyclase
MNILILDVYPKKKHRISKDTSGGYGTGNDFGDSIIPRTLKKILIKNSKWPPLFAAYTYSVLKKDGHNVVYKEELPKNFEFFDLVIIVSSIVSHETEIELIKKINNKVKIFVIGPFASNNSDKYLKYNLSIIMGEPEIFFFKNKDFFNLSKEKLISFDTKDFELDNLPYPEYTEMGYDLDKINNLFGRYKSVPLLATRGCPFSCFKYCVYPLQQGRKIRQRSIKGIIDEIKFWKEKYSVKNFIFRDPVFSINRKHTVELCEMLIKERININFIAETHLNILDSELIKLLKQAGLTGIKVGIESFDEVVIEEANRHTTTRDDQLKKIKELEKNKIQVSAMYILGFPADNAKTIMQTINYAKKLNTTYAQFSVWTPYPGTPVYLDYKEKIITEKMEDFDQYHLVFRHKIFSKEEIRYYLDKAYSSYYSRLKWIIKYMFSKNAIY